MTLAVFQCLKTFWCTQWSDQWVWLLNYTRNYGTTATFKVELPKWSVYDKTKPGQHTVPQYRNLIELLLNFTCNYFKKLAFAELCASKWNMQEPMSWLSQLDFCLQHQHPVCWLLHFRSSSSLEAWETSRGRRKSSCLKPTCSSSGSWLQLSSAQLGSGCGGYLGN